MPVVLRYTVNTSFYFIYVIQLNSNQIAYWYDLNDNILFISFSIILRGGSIISIWGKKHRYISVQTGLLAPSLQGYRFS